MSKPSHQTQREHLRQSLAGQLATLAKGLLNLSELLEREIRSTLLLMPYMSTPMDDTSYKMQAKCQAEHLVSYQKNILAIQLSLAACTVTSLALRECLAEQL